MRHLHPGLEPAVAGARCASSYTALGTNVGGGSLRHTAVTDLWYVRFGNARMGWIVKTAGGTYWYESPDSAYYEEITAVNAGELMQAGVAIGGCFRGDLAL